MAIGLGLIGCGAFGNFCLEQYREMDEITIIGVTDTVSELAQKTSERFGVTAYDSVTDMLQDNEIDIVHLATPPKTHYELAMTALQNGKHVLCEKPLATSAEHAKEMVETARSKDLILAVNLIMRYNPLCEAVQKILSSKLLGEPIHAFFENYAGDDKLGPDHWFWDKDLSGGIFIEHGVHFFDLYNGWLGDGKVEVAQTSTRPGAPQIEEQVHALVRHPNGVTSSHYHGFHQTGRMDRQEFRIVCERGDIRMFEWVPTEIEVDFLATEADAQTLADIIPNATLETIAHYTGDERHIRSRHKDYDADGHYRITGNNGLEKQALYGHIVSALMADQIAAIRNPDHKRKVTEQNGYHSLMMAVNATQIASSG